MKHRPLTIPTLVGIGVSLFGLGAGLWFLRQPIKIVILADSETTPSQVRVTNITDSSFVVSWVTAKATSGYVQYSEGPNPNLVVSDDRDQTGGSVGSYFTHFVTVSGLKPDTTYNWRIGSGGRLYDQQGSLYSVTTGLALGSPPAADVAYGRVNTASGEPAEGAIVYLSLTGVVPQAGLVRPSGVWVIPLSTARSADLTSFAAYDLSTSQIQLEVVGGPLGTATVVTTTAADSPVPVIVLGQNYNLASTKPQPIPADRDSSPSSRFSTSALAPIDKSVGELVVLSPKLGEQVNSQTPQIIGVAPASSQVVITVESPTTVTGTVVADAEGNFTYTVPQKLDPGEHTLTISTSVNGIMKKIQRKFVVLAAGESPVPAFTASPSAKLKPSPTPTLPPRIAMPATESGVPTSGNLTPTLVLFILGVAMIVGGTVLFRKLEN